MGGIGTARGRRPVRRGCITSALDPASAPLKNHCPPNDISKQLALGKVVRHRIWVSGANTEQYRYSKYHFQTVGSSANELSTSAGGTPDGHSTAANCPRVVHWAPSRLVITRKTTRALSLGLSLSSSPSLSRAVTKAMASSPRNGFLCASWVHATGCDEADALFFALFALFAVGWRWAAE